MVDEALDAVSGTRNAAGIHIVATAAMCSKNATPAEIALAGEILRQDPKRAMPRELAGTIDTFNRHMDAAIESCNRSSGEPTRAGRRARLASDLERAGLVMIEQATLAELLSRTLAGPDPLEDEDPVELEPDLTVEETDALVARINGTPNLNLQPCEHPTAAIYQVPQTGAYKCGRCGASTGRKLLLGRHV